jgi:hypothetical protein
MSRVINAIEMGFVRIAEEYPDEYILVRIIEINHEKGRMVGIALYTAKKRSELVAYAKKEGLINETVILQGENLVPVLGGLL